MAPKGTLLLVEDESMLLELLRSIFEEEGYRVLTAKNGEEALRAFQLEKGGVDLVLSDMGLPKLGGWEVFQRLRELDPHVKMILASGFVDASVRDDMMKQGAVDVFQKPYVPHLILERVRQILAD